MTPTDKLRLDILQYHHDTHRPLPAILKEALAYLDREAGLSPRGNGGGRASYQKGSKKKPVDICCSGRLESKCFLAAVAGFEPAGPGISRVFRFKDGLDKPLRHTADMLRPACWNRRGVSFSCLYSPCILLCRISFDPYVSIHCSSKHIHGVPAAELQASSRKHLHNLLSGGTHVIRSDQSASPTAQSGCRGVVPGGVPDRPGGPGGGPGATP